MNDYLTDFLKARDDMVVVLQDAIVALNALKDPTDVGADHFLFARPRPFNIAITCFTMALDESLRIKNNTPLPEYMVQMHVGMDIADSRRRDVWERHVVVGDMSVTQLGVKHGVHPQTIRTDLQKMLRSRRSVCREAAGQQLLYIDRDRNTKGELLRYAVCYHAVGEARKEAVFRGGYKTIHDAYMLLKIIADVSSLEKVSVPKDYKHVQE